MNPDVVSAVARLRSGKVLSGEQSALVDRVARRLLVSVRFEIRALLYAGVLLLTSGVGLLVKEHHREIGPWAIAVAIGLAAAGCLVWVGRKAAPFSWGEAPSPNVAFDYVLLLGLLLFASELAYVEVQFTLLGANWAHHLLVVGIVYVAAAYLWDSRTILGLALTTLAAWRGVSATVLVIAGLAAVYAAVNVYSLDRHLVENLGWIFRSHELPSRDLLVPAALATAVLPPAVLAWGLLSRRTFLIDTGIVLTALSLVTLRHYVHLAPLWVVLTLSGAGLVALALAVERRLRRAPGGELAGFTAEPLFSDERRLHAMEVVPVVAAFTAAPGQAAGEEDIGRGGRFGGGGAGEKF